MPTPHSAMSRGSPIATTEPNASSMMMTAAVIPMPSLEPGAAVTTLSAGVPPTATRRPGRADASAGVMTLWAARPGSQRVGRVEADDDEPGPAVGRHLVADARRSAG